MEVIYGASALALNGLSTALPSWLVTTINHESLNGVSVGRRVFFHRPAVDKTHYLTKVTVRGEDLLLPSKERAIVECISDLDCVDESFVCEAIVAYLERYGTREDLLRVSRMFNITEDQLDYWISESYEYMDSCMG